MISLHLYSIEPSSSSGKRSVIGEVALLLIVLEFEAKREEGPGVEMEFTVDLEVFRVIEEVGMSSDSEETEDNLGEPDEAMVQ